MNRSFRSAETILMFDIFNIKHKKTGVYAGLFILKFYSSPLHGLEDTKALKT